MGSGLPGCAWKGKVKADGGGSRRRLVFLCLGGSESSCDEWSSELEGVRKKGRAMRASLRVNSL
jgi:hypothetical protein